MTNISIKPTKQTPEVLIDIENMYLYIQGYSRPEDTDVFYGPLIKKIDEYKEILKANKTTMKIEVFIVYFNSSSLKFLLELFRTIKKYKTSELLELHWHYEKDDEDVQEIGSEFSEALNVPITFYEK